MLRSTPKGKLRLPVNLRETLNLPNPDFTIPMKADLPVREPELQRKWAEMSVYKVIQDARRGRPKFILHDGPPYTNSPVHTGTARNKALKDFVVKYKTLRGFHSPYVPGYDTHGLPIELAVTAKLGTNISPAEMRKACRKHAEEYIRIQTEQFQRLGVFGDWGRSYATLHYGFEASVVRAFGKLAEAGYVYKDLRPTHWSIKSKTALADTELVYEERTSRAIFVRFPLRSDPNGVFDGLSPLYTVIWTTTPWTIPANLAVAFHPELEYSVVEHDGDHYLFLSDLVSKVSEQLGWSNVQAVGRHMGRDLLGVAFKHPVFDRDSIVVLADYVNTEEGTGVVHTAPGHGAEDFYTGKEYGLPILCPVDEGGHFTAEAFEFAGLHINEADEAVPKRLQEEGNLLLAYDYVHSYPHSERDKSPVIFRATEQWFINLSHDNLKERALEAIRGVKWFPKAGEARISSMVEGRPDWCVSRQRTWGVGIPILYGVPSNKPCFDPEIIERVARIVEQGGSDAWFEASVKEIIPPGYAHPETGETEFRKETDTLDVWFESGVTHLAVLSDNYMGWEDLEWPSDLYLEGSDQHRGWFNSSLLTAIAIKGSAPYRQVVTHGWLVDEIGEKMSKSKGNVIEPVDAANRYGADILRLWAGSVDYSRDVSFGEQILRQVSDEYRRIRNTMRFLLANLSDFDPNGGFEAILDVDRWAIAKTRILEADACRDFDEYDFSAAMSRVHDFCARELSAFYLDVIKDRMYCDGADWPSRRSAQAACHEILLVLTRLIAPVLSHTAEEVYERIPLQQRHPTVFLEVIEPKRMSEHDPVLLDRFSRFLDFKDRLYVEMEKWKAESDTKDSQDIYVRVKGPEDLVALLQSFGEDLPTLLRVSWVELGGGDVESYEFQVSDFLKCERSRLRRPDVALVNGVALSERDRKVLGL